MQKLYLKIYDLIIPVGIKDTEKFLRSVKIVGESEDKYNLTSLGWSGEHKVAQVEFEIFNDIVTFPSPVYLLVPIENLKSMLRKATYDK